MADTIHTVYKDSKCRVQRPTNKWLYRDTESRQCLCHCSRPGRYSEANNTVNKAWTAPLEFNARRTLSQTYRQMSSQRLGHSRGCAFTFIFERHSAANWQSKTVFESTTCRVQCLKWILTMSTGLLTSESSETGSHQRLCHCFGPGAHHAPYGQSTPRSGKQHRAKCPSKLSLRKHQTTQLLYKEAWASHLTS